MSSHFFIYDPIMVLAWLVALAIIKPRNAFDLSRCAGWYLLVFLSTYVVRPTASELVGDFTMYKWLRLGSFDEHWKLMAMAAPMAILSFAVGYRAGAPFGAKKRAAEIPRFEPAVNPQHVRVLIFTLLVLGYISAIFVLKSGSGGETLHYADATVGTYEHNTAWFAQDDVLISSATVLYYILTGRLGMSLLLAGPWIFIRVLVGWGRTNLLGHFFALMCVYFLRKRLVTHVKEQSGHAFAIGAGLVLMLILFPLMGMLRGLKQTLNINSLLSKDALMMVGSSTNTEDLTQDYFGTNSPVSGFEVTLSHLLNDNRSELGTQYLYYYFIEPIPRILWRGKGTPYTWPEKLRGIEVDPLLGVIGAAPGSIGMAYEQWGWAGIPLEFLLTGLILRKCEEAARRRPKALHLQLGYAGIYSMVPQLGRDSLFYMIPGFWLFKFGIPVFILWRMYKAEALRVKARTRRSFGLLSPVAPTPGAAA